MKNTAVPLHLSSSEITVEIGGLPIQLQTSDPCFRRLLEERYAGFLNSSAVPACRFKIQLTPNRQRADLEVNVFKRAGKWCLKRGDFRAEWDLRRRESCIRQCANPYSIDSVLRITHSLLLAMESGFQPSSADCEKSFLCTGVVTADMRAGHAVSPLGPPRSGLVQIQLYPHRWIPCPPPLFDCASLAHLD